MTKKLAKPARSASEKRHADTPKKRPRLKLAMLAAAPLVLVGGGYAGWTMLAPAGAGAAAGQADAGEGRDDADAMHVSSVSTALEAETSFTHAYALAVLIAPRCGTARVPALQAASDAEARADGMLATLSWQAAARRVAATTERSCDFLRAEVIDAERQAMKLSDGKGPGKSGH